MINKYVPIQMTTSLLVEIALCPGTQVTCSMEGFGRPRPDQVEVIAVYSGPGGGSEAAKGLIFDMI
jgi:hypothetical protein